MPRRAPSQAPPPEQLLLLLSLLAGLLADLAVAIPCEEARLKCAYRDGCGGALQNYLTGCSAVLEGALPQRRCPQICQHSLVALISTAQGKELMECECSDSYCETQKRRTEVCRPIVMHTMTQPVFACRMAEEICSADSACSNALYWYNRYCKAMFIGERCSLRCRNSINILMRQSQASKLSNCRCDVGDYECHDIQRNLHRLCLKHHHHHGGSAAGGSATGGKETPKEAVKETAKETERHEQREEVVPTVVFAGSDSNALSGWWVVSVGMTVVAMVT